ncbi:hypothetical protein [Streptomyces sp. 8N616]|uniref:hypothetical protein n=1 Tax=Streptomyces sp. 8N616 TaxID=3457414 RepID=UPI003FCF3096
MRALRAVLDEGFAVAQQRAAAQVHVHPVEEVDAVLQFAERLIAEGRVDRARDVALVGLPGRQLEVGLLEPAL